MGADRGGANGGGERRHGENKQGGGTAEEERRLQKDVGAAEGNEKCSVREGRKGNLRAEGIKCPSL